MAASSEWMHPADDRILRYLEEHPPDYVPLIANRLGMHLGYVERRVDALVDHGLVEPISGESIYAVTDRGERYVADERMATAADGDDD
jgi:DNA-binding MarR family transcriptional regulator